MMAAMLRTSILVSIVMNARCRISFVNKERKKGNKAERLSVKGKDLLRRRPKTVTRNR